MFRLFGENLDLHADLLVEDLEVHDQMHVHANSNKALQTASPKIRQSGRSLQVGTVSGMIGQGHAKTWGAPSRRRAITNEIPILVEVVCRPRGPKGELLRVID